MKVKIKSMKKKNLIDDINYLPAKGRIYR